MQWKWNGSQEALGANGLPQPVTGLEEVLQNAAMAISLRRGGFLYQAGLGSGLRQLDPQEEHSEERARALAEEALLPLPGVQVKQAQYEPLENLWHIQVETPLGAGEITVSGKESKYGNL